MSDPAELLLLMHGARERTRTVRASVRTWRHLRRLREAMERNEFVAYAELGGAEPEPEAFESLIRVWLAPPDRAREERDEPDGASIAVRHGRRWWSYHPLNGAVSNEGQPDSDSGIGDEFRWLLDAASAIGLLDFTAIESGRRAGRHVLRVRAVPRALARGEDGPLMRLGALGADELLLDVDAERGGLLRIEARYGGQPLAISEVLEIAYDERFAEDTFVFEPPPGEEVRSVDDEPWVQAGLAIEQAVARALFTIWIPARVPPGWTTEIGFAAEQQRPPAAAHVFLHYRALDAMHGFSITESPVGQPDVHHEYGPARPGPWRDVTRDARPMQVREPAESWQPAQVRLELDGTLIFIHSNDLGADALVDLAAGLAPAPSSPPELRA